MFIIKKSRKKIGNNVTKEILPNQLPMSYDHFVLRTTRKKMIKKISLIDKFDKFIILEPAQILHLVFDILLRLLLLKFFKFLIL